jgi:DNA-binding FadR family transcriptional regulator
VSRSTVREALRLLASQHLIVTTRGVTGGSFVAHPDAKQLSEALSTGLTLLTNSAGIGFADLLELRRALEVPAAALAAVRRTEAHLAEMQAALFNPEIDDFDVMLRAHSDFHGAVAKATGNPLFELVTLPLYHVSYGQEVTESLPDGYWARIDADHRELLRHLTDRDSVAAQTVAQAHLDYIVAANQR